ncbi:MAG: nickel pincer cofactor biosynthesis protein LarB [Desulforhopalus sp.]
MDTSLLSRILTNVQKGSLSVEEALVELRRFPEENLPGACIDSQRRLRTGIPEVIYGASKTAEQIIAIAETMLGHGDPVLVTRVVKEKASLIQSALPALNFYPEAAMLSGNPRPLDSTRYRGRTLVLCAGTSDIPVAEEARITLSTFGHPVDTIYDAGVAGLHRLLSRQQMLYRAMVIIVVAGMEGALPSVVSGLVSCPVIAVPTSVGYGASFGGIAALLGMLNSCAPGIAVVNIDNGFGAACMAEAINSVRPSSHDEV